MNRSRLLVLAAALPILAAGPANLRAEEPFTPTNDDLILVRLPASARKPAPQPAATPAPATATATGFDTARLATKQPAGLGEVRRWIEAARREGDPRWLGRARAVLDQAMATGAAPTAESWVLRAEILQGLHAFEPALAATGEALRLDPRHPGAWLIKAGIHQVRGETGPARQASLQLARFAEPLTALTVAASLRSLEDAGPTPESLLDRALAEHPGADPETRAWAWTTLGEIQQRRHRTAEAEASFRKSLALLPERPYPLAAQADLLLDLGRADEVLAQLRDASTEALRLRRAEAARIVQPDAPETRRWIAELADAFRLSNERGDELHLREQARFRLRLEDDSAAALRLARRNWEIQKEPADLQLLVEAARAAGDPATETAARDWARIHQPAVPLPGPQAPSPDGRP